MRKHWLNPADCAFLTSLGGTRETGNHSRADWVQMVGPVDGEPVGITVFSHPQNFRAPQPARLHPQLPYFCFAPMVLGDFQLLPGKPYRMRYRFTVHDGLPDRLAAESHWRDYDSPPTITVGLPPQP